MQLFIGSLSKVAPYAKYAHSLLNYILHAWRSTLKKTADHATYSILYILTLNHWIWMNNIIQLEIQLLRELTLRLAIKFNKNEQKEYILKIYSFSCQFVLHCPAQHFISFCRNSWVYLFLRYKCLHDPHEHWVYWRIV